MTDTSYFPTDELENVPDVPVGADTEGSNKDLAFLGYVHRVMASPDVLKPSNLCSYTFKRFTLSSAAF
jgi:hypothetical protein